MQFFFTESHKQVQSTEIFVAQNMIILKGAEHRNIIYLELEYYIVINYYIEIFLLTLNILRSTSAVLLTSCSVL
jgi:hypothetical protein